MAEVNDPRNGGYEYYFPIPGGGGGRLEKRRRCVVAEETGQNAMPDDAWYPYNM